MNRHKRIAILMAPVLAIGGYIAADYYQQRQQSAKLPRLQVLDDCRPLQNACRLQAGELILNVAMQSLQQQTPVPVTLISSVPLDDVLIAFDDGQPDAMPLRMESNEQATFWQLKLQLGPQIDLRKLMFRLVVTYKDNNYFAETAVKP